MYSTLKSTIGVTTALGLTLVVAGPYYTAQANGCPIAIDLNDDGRIGITGLSTSRLKPYNLFVPLFNVLFDLDGDGQKQSVEWLDGEGDGFLLDMRNFDETGQPTGSNLFGTAGGYENGFVKIAELDTDGDGVLRGGELDLVAIWQDNGDAVFQPAELRKLADYGIVEIRVIPKEVPGPDDLPLLVSSAASASGEIYMEDIWLLDASVAWSLADLAERWSIPLDRDREPEA